MDLAQTDWFRQGTTGAAHRQANQNSDRTVALAPHS
jgi:hypothetical protein